MTMAKIRPTTDSRIDDNLKRVYEDLLQEDLPDRFKSLLDQLRGKEAGEPARGTSEKKEASKGTDE